MQLLAAISGLSYTAVRNAIEETTDILYFKLAEPYFKTKIHEDFIRKNSTRFAKEILTKDEDPIISVIDSVDFRIEKPSSVYFSYISNIY